MKLRNSKNIKNSKNVGRSGSLGLRKSMLKIHCKKFK